MPQPSGSHRMQAAACAIAAAGRFLPVGLALALAACSGQQSALQPSGSGAREAAILRWVMLGGAGLVFALVLDLLLYAILQPPERRRPISVDRMVIGGGIALPVVALSLLLVFGLRMGFSTYAELPPEAPTVRVKGQEWWWEVEYAGHDPTQGFTMANRSSCSSAPRM